MIDFHSDAQGLQPLLDKDMRNTGLNFSGIRLFMTPLTPAKMLLDAEGNIQQIVEEESKRDIWGCHTEGSGSACSLSPKSSSS